MPWIFPAFVPVSCLFEQGSESNQTVPVSDTVAQWLGVEYRILVYENPGSKPVHGFLSNTTSHGGLVGISRLEFPHVTL